jgi:uncharacterized membrane protein
MIQTEHAWTVLIAAHALAASLSLVLGAGNLARRPKGDRPHRIVGRTWAGLMYFTALSSFFIQTIAPGSFSWIHALSALTLVTLTLGLWHARRGQVRLHAANMVGSYLGLCGAFIGVVAVPHRLVPQAFQSNWAGMGALTLGVIVTGVAVIYAAAAASRSPVDSGTG